MGAQATDCHSTRGLIRSFHHSEFPLELLLERKREPVTVVLPTREVADTIGPIVERLLGLRGLVDQVLVVDAASEDGTAELAAAGSAPRCTRRRSSCPSSGRRSARATPCGARCRWHAAS